MRTRDRRSLDAQDVAALRVSQVNRLGDTVERDRPRRRIGNRPHAVRTGGKFRTVYLERPGRGESSGAIGAWGPDASPRHERSEELAPARDRPPVDDLHTRAGNGLRDGAELALQVLSARGARAEETETEGHCFAAACSHTSTPKGLTTGTAFWRSRP